MIFFSDRPGSATTMPRDVITITGNTWGWDYTGTDTSIITPPVREQYSWSLADSGITTNCTDDLYSSSISRYPYITVSGSTSSCAEIWHTDSSNIDFTWQPATWQFGNPHVWAVDDEYAKKRAAAKERARGLLVSHLTPNQQQEYIEHGYFHVVTPKKHRYRILQGQISNVIRLNKRGKPMRAFCIHPVGCLPDEDAMLAQKLMLENDEEAFLRIANHRKVHLRARLDPWVPRNRNVA